MKTSVIKPGGAVTECRNLMPDGKGSLIPAPGPATVSLPDGYVPVKRARNMLIARKGRMLSIISNGEPVFTLTLDYDPLDVYEYGNLLLAETPDDNMQLIGIDYSGRKLYAHGPLKGSVPNPNKLSLRFYKSGPVSATVEPVSLSKRWRESGTLSASDISALSASVRRAAESVSKQACRLGNLIHPVLVMGRVRDGKGRIVHEWMPRLFRVPQAEALPMSFQLTENASSGTSERKSISTASYRISLEFDSNSWVQAYPGGKLEILASPVFPVFDPSGTPEISPRQRADDPYFCTVKLPVGEAACLSDFSEINLTRFLRLADHESLPWTVIYEWRLSPGILNFTGLPMYTQNVAVRRQLDEVKVAPEPKPYPFWPHSFSASAKALAGDLALWADLTVRRAPVAPFNSFVASSAETQGNWHGYVAVKFADGQVLVDSATGVSSYPSLFNPLLGYPAPDAVSLTLAWWSPSAGHYKQTFRLVSDPSGSRSIYIHPSGLPFALERSTEAFAVPDPVEKRLRFPDRLVATPIDAPWLPVALGNIPAGEILCLLPVAASDGAWDYGRRRFMGFTTAGVYMVRVDPRNASMSVSLVDRRILNKAGYAVATPRGIAAVMDNELVLFSGNRSSTLASDVGDRSPVWCGDCGGEIWLLGTEDVAVVRPDCPGISYYLDGSFIRASAGPWLHGSKGWCLPGHDAPSAMVPVKWQGVMPVRRNRLGHPMLVELNLRGTVSGLNLTLARSYIGKSAPGPDLRLVLNGTLRSPLRRTFFAPPSDEFVANLEGYISVFSSLNSINIDRYA